ncbi:MAG TPA: phage holin family protein [Polyangia bacterium]|nr:phage holin family protein [Polyangia bacterium]
MSRPPVAATSARNGAEPPLLSLVKEVIDGLGTVLAGHVRLARVELAADVVSESRRVALMALLSAVALLGYGLGCVAGSLALARLMSAPLAFLAVGGANLLGAGVALGWLLSRPAAPLLGESAWELDRTVSALKASATTADAGNEGSVERLASHDVA